MGAGIKEIREIRTHKLCVRISQLKLFRNSSLDEFGLRQLNRDGMVHTQTASIVIVSEKARNPNQAIRTDFGGNTDT